MEDGNQTPAPQFAGKKGLEISKGLKEIEDGFIKSLRTLRNHKKSILDVRSTTWHGDFTK